MHEESTKWDRQWRDLLTRCHGDVQADEGFKATLLRNLKEKTAQNRETVSAPDVTEDRNWNRLLNAAYVPCEPDARFKGHLLTQLKARQTQLTGPVRTQAEEDALKTILTASYAPVEPRREFQTRLLENLKERQRNTAVIRRSSRRRTIFLSALSSMAAAAAVLFVVAAPPVVDSARPAQPDVRVSAPVELADASSRAAAEPVFPAPTQSASFADDVAGPTGSGLAFASFSPYDVDVAFASNPLSTGTVRGVNTEMNAGDGWKAMAGDVVVALAPGMLFRPSRKTEGATGLGFGDGTTILMCSDSLIESTEKGIAVRNGTMSVEVPENADTRFLMHFPERDLAVEPGTMLAVTVPSADEYAEGGAPAPLIRVADGGLAIAKGSGGSGPLFANRVYRLDRYVTPDLPSRPLCDAEREELRRSLPRSMAPERRSESGSPALFASAGGTFAPAPVAPKNFVQKGTRWFDKAYDNQHTVKIKYLSPEYFGFVNSRRDLAQAFALGSEVVIDGGDGNYYEIHK